MPLLLILSVFLSTVMMKGLMLHNSAPENADCENLNFKILYIRKKN